ncbi:MAG: ATP-binding protein [Anaerolineae bacterium]
MQEKLLLLNQITDELNTDLDLDNMLQRVIDLTVTHFRALNGSIMLFDENKRVIKYILQQKNVSDAQAHKIVGQVLTEGFAGWVLKHGRGDIIPDTQHDDRWYTFPNQPYTARSVIATPLIRRNHVTGILTINHDKPDRFSRQDLSLLNAISGQAAIALENAQLFRQTELERAKLSAIINSTQDVVIVTRSPDNRVILMNPAAEKILHLEAGSWRDRPLGQITTLTDLTRLLSAAPPAGGELQLPDGRTLVAGIINVPNVGKLTLMHDISALKALNKMKSEFITTFTHDLSAPLAAIKGHLELMKIDGPVTDRQQEDLNAIRLAADQMRTLIKDLLELNRLESLKNFFTCDISLRETLQKTFSAFRPMAAAKKINLALDASMNHIVTQGNPALISRAIDNLVENAIKYTAPNGNVTLSLTAHRQEARVAIKDTGMGISPGNLPQVFDKFYRAHTPGDNEIPGSGLGLSIVKTIVERHGGHVWVESEMNVGSTFTIALPIYANGSDA